jgi:flagellar basal-body rod protein FlgF
MDNALYVGLSKQMILNRELDVTANNLANVDTAGFKVESVITQDDPVMPAHAPPGATPVQFALDQGVARDFTQGSMQQTGAPLDLGIEGKGFFQVQTQAGIRYTRDGRFGSDAQGQLIDAQGDAVLDAGGSPISLNAQGGSPQIGLDGTVTQSIPGQPQPAVIGKVGVVTFDSLGGLTKSGDGLYQNTTNAQATPASSAIVRQGMLESSNVQPILQVTDLIRISRAYESVSQMMSDNSDLSKSAIQRLGSVQ